MDMVKFSDIKVDKDLANQRIAFSALVVQSELKDMAKGGKYLYLKVKDQGHEEVAKMWNATEEDLNILQVGKAFDFAMDVKPYAASPSGVSLIVAQYQVSAADPKSFVEWAPDVAERAQDIWGLVQVIQGSVYGTIVNKLLRNNWDAFASLPAGKSMHHTETGGLLWHTSSVAQLCLASYNHYVRMYGQSSLNFPLLMAGAILHDIGKVHELAFEETGTAVDYSQESIFGGHLLIGVRMIDREAVNLGVADTEEIKLLEHLVASHHGSTEFGALVTPAVPEASILSQADVTDAMMWRHMKAMKELRAGEHQSAWSHGSIQHYYKDLGKADYPAKAAEADGVAKGQEAIPAAADAAEQTHVDI